MDGSGVRVEAARNRASWTGREGQTEFNAGAESASPGTMGDPCGSPAHGWIRAGSRT